MTREDKALVILEALEKVITVDWNFQEVYVKAIVDGLVKIEKEA